MGAKGPRTQTEIDRERYNSSFKIAHSFYIDDALYKEIKQFCLDNNIRQGFFAYVALKKELESQKLEQRKLYWEPM